MALTVYNIKQATMQMNVAVRGDKYDDFKLTSMRKYVMQALKEKGVDTGGYGIEADSGIYPVDPETGLIPERVLSGEGPTPEGVQYEQTFILRKAL